MAINFVWAYADFGVRLGKFCNKRPTQENVSIVFWGCIAGVYTVPKRMCLWWFGGGCRWFRETHFARSLMKL